MIHNEKAGKNAKINIFAKCLVFVYTVTNEDEHGKMRKEERITYTSDKKCIPNRMIQNKA